MGREGIGGGREGQAIAVRLQALLRQRRQPVADARGAWQICSTAECMLPTPEALGLNADQDQQEAHDQTQRSSLRIGGQQRCNAGVDIPNLQNKMHSSDE